MPIASSSAVKRARPDLGDGGAAHHLVQFYDDNETLGNVVSRFIAEGVEAGDALVIIATQEHWSVIDGGLAQRGIASGALRSAGRLHVLNAERVLGELMVDGELSKERFDELIGGLIARLLAPAGSKVRAYGEMVDVLWKEGKRSVAIQLEELWNELQAQLPFALLCAYAAAGFYREPAATRQVCGVHSHIRDLHDGLSRSRTLEPLDAPALHEETARRIEIEMALRDALHELRTQQAHTQRSREQLEAIADSLPVSVALVSRALRYVFVNAEYARNVGQPKADIVGATLAAVLGAAECERIEPHVGQALAGNRACFQAERLTGAGAARIVEATYLPQRDRDENVTGFVGLIVDVTERARTERVRAAALERTARLLQITAAVAEAVTPEQVYDAVVREVAAVLTASSAALWLIEDDENRAALVRSVGYGAPAQADFRAMRLDSTAASPALDVLQHGAAIWISSQEELLRRYAGLAHAVTPGRSYRIACLPLATGGRALGALALTIEEAREWSEEERSFLMLVARYAGQALERVRLLSSEQASRARADAAAARAHTLSTENADARTRAEQLYLFAQAVVAADNQEQVFEVALDAIGVTLRTDRAAVLIFDQRSTMRFRAWRGLSDAYRKAVEGHSPWSVDTIDPQPVLIGDVRGDASVAQYEALFLREGIGALAFFPILSRGKLLGKLMVYHRDPHDYSESELDVAASIGAHLGSIVSRFAATERLQETVHYNELFAGILAHDLRNPLAAVLTAAQLMRMRFGEADERSAKPLSKILSSGQRMARMIEQLLDVTRARAGGGIEVHRHKVDLAEVCEQAAGELELAHPSWNIQCASHGDSIGMCDRDRLAQVLSNLLANAGQHGQSEAGIRLLLDGRDEKIVVLKVHNQGSIPPELMTTLFDPFRGSTMRRGVARGLGLGLFIVKEIVRAHGGTITVDSSEEHGTTFTISLPRQ